MACAIPVTSLIQPLASSMRLRMAAVSPRLLEVYADDEMTLEQLMAFSVSPDHERQEQVWEAIQRSYNKEPYQIRRMLTEGAVRANGKRAQYAGDSYVAEAGAVTLIWSRSRKPSGE